MTSGGTDALEQAIALYRAPGRLPMLQERPLPAAVLVLLRIVANDRVAIDSAANTTGETSDTLTDAATLYIQQVMFAASSDAYRLLGVQPEAADAQVKEHYRWLMRWLHPDRQSERWEVVYSDRVNRAWQELRPDRRENYVSAPVTEGDSAPWEPIPRGSTGGAMRAIRAPIPVARPLLSARMTTRLPYLVLGGLAILAVAMVWVLYATREDIPVFSLSPDVEQAEPHPQLPHAIPSSEQVLAEVRERAVADRAHPASSLPPTSAAATAAPIVAAPGTLPTVPVIVLSSQRLPREPARTPMLPATPSVSTQNDVVSQSETPRKTRRALAAEQSEQARVANAREPAIPDTASKPPPSAEAATYIDSVSAKEATRSVSRAFARAYAGGDLVAMMQLFSVDAVNNRGGVQAIAQDYDHLFRSTVSRRLKLDRLAWTTSPDRIIGSGPFEAVLVRKNKAPAETVDGWVTIEATLVDGDWRIKRIIHRNAP